MGLFTPATPDARRLKMLIYGASGSGKTVTSLHMPGVVIIDMDGGSDWYMNHFKFDRLRTNDVDKVFAAVDELIKEPGNYKTLVIDSITKFWELLQEKHLKKLRVKKGKADYTFQPLDYKAIKSDLKSFINKLLALDMNIVVTAQSKTLYSQDPGEFMKVIGTEADGPKEAPYLFDVVLELTATGEDTRSARVIKDRTNTLPKTPFDFTYQKLTECFGIKELEREPVKLRAEQALNQLTNRNTKIKIGGKDIFTAGVTAETLQKLVVAVKKLSESELRDKLNEDYSVQNILDLREDEARLLYDDLTKQPTV